MQHHQKVGKKIADIDSGNQEAPKEQPVEKPQSKSTVPPMPETKPTGVLSNFVGKKVRIKTASKRKRFFEGTVHHLGFFYGSGVYRVGEHEQILFDDMEKR